MEINDYVDFCSSNIHYFRMTSATYYKKLYNKVTFDLWAHNVSK